MIRGGPCGDRIVPHRRGVARSSECISSVLCVCLRSWGCRRVEPVFAEERFSPVNFLVAQQWDKGFALHFVRSVQIRQFEDRWRDIDV